jgi:hypothetical protein
MTMCFQHICGLGEGNLLQSRLAEIEEKYRMPKGIYDFKRTDMAEHPVN